MKQLFRILATTCTGLLIATVALAGAPAEQTDGPEYSIEPIRIDPWQLLQSDGEELYQQMCASCHGAEALGNGPAARQLAKYPPPLVTLSALNVPRAHWTYVIQSPCDDAHHRAANGAITMPCWKRAFREALGNDAAPILVTARLVDYLETIQLAAK